jgi:hypothetical protein
MRHGVKSTLTEKEDIFQGIFLEIIAVVVVVIVVVVIVVVVIVVDFDVTVGILFDAAVDFNAAVAVECC